MAASWPNSIWAPTTKVDNVDIDYAAHINAAQAEIVALESILGLLPQGGQSTVRARLDAIEASKLNASDIGTISHNALANLTVGDPHTQYVGKALYAAKGTVLAGTGAGTVGALAVAGTDGLPLESNSTAGVGIGWGTKAVKHALGTAAGQLLVSDGTNFVVIPTTGVADGWGLVFDSTQPLKVKWATILPEDVEVFGQSGTLAVTSGHGRFRWPWPVQILGVAAVVNTPSAGASVIVDVMKALAASLASFSTIYTTQSTRPTVAAGTYDSGETVPQIVNFAAGDHMRIDIAQIGTTTAGSDLQVFVRYRRTA